MTGDAFAVAAAFDARQRPLDARQRTALLFADAVQHDNRCVSRRRVLPVCFRLGDELVLVGQRLAPARKQGGTPGQERASKGLQRLVVHASSYSKQDRYQRGPAIGAGGRAPKRRIRAGADRTRKNFAEPLDRARARRAS
jgi:hypothetical protein